MGLQGALGDGSHDLELNNEAQVPNQGTSHHSPGSQLLKLPVDRIITAQKGGIFSEFSKFS